MRPELDPHPGAGRRSALSLRDGPSERYAPGAAEPRRADVAQASVVSTSPYWLVASALFLVGLAALVGLFWETAASAVRTWTSSDSYNHCFLVIPICAYLIWRRREVFTRLAPRPSLWGIAAAALMAVVWKLGEVSALLVIQQLALIGMTQALFLAVMGPRVTRALAFPLLYLYFAVPFGGFLIAPLQETTAHIIVRLLQISGVPVYLDGLLIHIPAGSFHIAEACAGARFLFTSVAIGVLAADLFYSRWDRRILFIILSALVPILANGLRAFGIVMVAHLDSFEFAREVDHVTFGLVFLGLVMAILLALGMAFREKGRASAGSPAGAFAAPSSGDPSYPRYVASGIAAFAVVAGVSGLWRVQAPSDFVRPAELSAPGIDDPWTSFDNRSRDWRPSFMGADIELVQSYTDGERIVDLYLAYYASQRQGAEVVNQQNNLAGGAPWSLAQGPKVDAVLDGGPAKFASARLVSGRAVRIVWYWYWVDGKFTASPVIAKLRQAKVGLFGGSHPAAFIAGSTKVSDSEAVAAEVLQDFLRNLHPLSEWLALPAMPFGATGATSMITTRAGRKPG